MGHRGKLAGSLILTILAMGCMAVSYSFPWYRILNDESVTNIETKTYFWWDRYINYNTDNEKTGEHYYKDNDMDNVKQVFAVTLSFLSGAALAALITALFQIIGIISKSRFFRILSGIGGLAIFALMCVSFFTFFGITRAFDKDDACLPYEAFDDDYCRSFMGSSKLLTVKVTYQPYIGFWVGIGAIVLGLLTGITSFLA